MKNRPFFLLSIVALVANVWVILSMSRHTKEAELIDQHGYAKPILALEFTQDSTLVAKVFSNSTSVTRTLEQRVESIQKATYYDYGFLLVYGLFLFFFAVQCRRIWVAGTGLAMALALLASLADGVENVYLLKIFQKVLEPAPDYTGLFGPLHFWTSVKFFALGAYFIAISPFLWRGGWLGRIAVAGGAGALVCWVPAVFNSPEYWADALFGCILLAFLGTMLFGFFFKRDTEDNS